MAWIESHQTLRDHPKLSDLAHRLGIPKAQAIGHLQMLWWWCINYAEDGDISRYTPIQIAAACDWGGDPEILIKHLAESGFIDSDPLRVHDWLDFCGDLIKKRLEYKKAKHRRTKRLGKSLRKPENSQPTVTIPDRNQTVTNQTSVNVSRSPKVFSKPIPEEVKAYCQTIDFKLDVDRWFAHYESNGWRVGRNPMKDWKAAVRTWRGNEFGGVNGTNERKGISGLTVKKVWEPSNPKGISGLRAIGESSGGAVFDRFRNPPVRDDVGKEASQVGDDA